MSQPDELKPINLSDAQKKALEDVKEIMTEHFDGCVLVFTIESEDCKTDLTDVFWSGGYPLALGLLELGKVRLLQHQIEDKEGVD